MTRRIRTGRRTTMRSLAVLGGVALMAIGCAQGNTLPEQFQGRWYYLGSSGGIAGDGLGDDATGYIEIRADNVIASFDDDGTLLGSTPFTVSRGETIFSADVMWKMTHENGMTEVIMPSERADLIALAENVYDGISRGYARAR